jgi:hypothetical protein
VVTRVDCQVVPVVTGTVVAVLAELPHVVAAELVAWVEATVDARVVA